MKRQINQSGWWVILSSELSRLWLGWRGSLLLLIFGLFLSAFVILLSINPEINVLSQRKMLDQTIQVTVLVGIVVVLLLGSDSFSGERDQRSLESLLLTPVPRGQLVIGKLLAILSLWLGMIPIAIPYIIMVAKGTDVTAAAILLLLIPGTMLVGLSAAIAVIVSGFSPTNLVSFTVSFLLLLLLAAPTQLPGTVKELPLVYGFILSNPMTAATTYISTVMDGDPWLDGLALLASPIVALLLAYGLGPFFLNRRLSLQGGIES